MNFDEYQAWVRSISIFPNPDTNLEYPTLGLCGEAGEIANKVKKVQRDGATLDGDALADEVGDALWYVAALANVLGVRLSDIAARNVEKLESRKARDMLKGSGDRR